MPVRDTLLIHPNSIHCGLPTIPVIDAFGSGCFEMTQVNGHDAVHCFVDSLVHGTIYRLSVFSFREPRLSLADLASRTGIPRATAFRLLSTLEQSGFLRSRGSCRPFAGA